MADIERIDTDGVRSILGIGQLAVDNYTNGGDVGRVYVGDGSSNRALAFKDEIVAGSSIGSLQAKTFDELDAITPIDNVVYWYSDVSKYVYGNSATGKWHYFSNDQPIVRQGAGLGPAGTFTEDWGDDITIIATNWFSTDLTMSNNGTTKGNWNKHKGRTSSGSTGPDDAATGTYYLYTETSSNGHSTDFQISTTNFARLTEVSFQYNAYGASMGTVSLSARNGDVWTTYWTLTGNQGSGWKTATIDMTGSNAEEIMFRHVGATSYKADFAIDDIRITSV